MSNSSTSQTSTGAIRLLQDISKLLNNPQGSDVQFKVGGGGNSSNPNDDSLAVNETNIDPSTASAATAVTLYAHSAILCCRSRYFAAMFENNKDWKESPGVIYKPNISPSVFHKVLDYIYTGDVQAKTDNLLELLSAAEEMKLDELSIECQANIIVALKYSFNNEGEIIDDIQQRLPVSIAVDKLLLPALTLAQSRNIMVFFQELLKLAIKHIDIIFTSLDTSTIFFEKIPTPIFQQILASDELEIQEYDVWELAFGLACYKTKVPKATVETHFILENNADGRPGEGDGSEPLVSEEQLKQLKVNLTPLLPLVRFSLMKGDQYSRIVEILSFFLPARRSIELQRFHAQSEKMLPLDSPRVNWQKQSDFSTKNPDESPNPFSNIIDKAEMWQQIKTWILESNGINECRYLTFDLLFRASEHEFLASAFHIYCDNKGPTLVIVKSNDEHIFGGVNFSHWKSSSTWSGTASNFLFALADGHHRGSPAKFLYRGKEGQLRAICNSPSCGPIFGEGPFDLFINDKADTLTSQSKMPQSYSGIGASNTTFAGKDHFVIAEYEVFSISKS